MREVPTSINSKEFLTSVLKEGIRPDCRYSYDYRDINISFGPQWGHAEVLLGKTRVLARVSCQVSQPTLYRPNEGGLIFHVNLSRMSAGKFNSNKTDFSTVITRLLERTIKETRVIDTESLCIVSGEKVLKLRVDLTLLDYAGNAIDACCIAAMVALSHFKRPEFIVNGEEITVFSAKERDPVPLSVLHIPITCTIGFCGEKILVDPTDEEESVMDGYVSIATNTHHEICYIYLGGGVTLTPSLVNKCCEISSLKTQEISTLITKSLDNDKRDRKKSGTDKPTTINDLTLQEKLDRLYVDHRKNKKEIEVSDDVKDTAFSSITIRYIDDVETVDSDGTGIISSETPKSTPTTPMETESFPGF